MGDKAETYNVPSNVIQAYAARDSLAKTIYSRIFDYIVEKTNAALGRYQMQYSVVIGVLDIYGSVNQKTKFFWFFDVVNVFVFVNIGLIDEYLSIQIRDFQGERFRAVLYQLRE